MVFGKLSYNSVALSYHSRNQDFISGKLQNITQRGVGHMTLNEFERTLIDEALTDLLMSLQEGIPHFTNATAEDINQNTLAIASVKMKLKRIPAEHDQSFTLQELKVMYWALSDLRDTNLEVLDSIPLSDPDHAVAFDVQKSCNRLLHACRELLSQNGIDIQALFPHR